MAHKKREANGEQGRKAEGHVEAHTSIHPLAVCVIELRLGHVVPAFQTFGFHPDLYGAMHMDLCLLFTDQLWNWTRATPIDPVLETKSQNRGRCCRRSLHFVDERVVSRLCLVVGGLLECGNYGCIRREGLGPRGHEGIECSGIESDVLEGFAVELDSGVGEEALMDHPTKWNPGHAVPGTIRDRSTTDVYTTDGCQYPAPRHVTPRLR